MKTPLKLIAVAAAAGLGIFGIIGLNDSASASTGYSADCANVQVLGSSYNSVYYQVTNICAVGVTMNALVSPDGPNSGCNAYAPAGQPNSTQSFTADGANGADVADVVYC
jgi:hypothetical protein